MKVLFLPQTSDLSPAARFRVYQYLPYLEKAGIEVAVQPAIKALQHHAVYTNPQLLTKFCYYSLAVAKRLGNIKNMLDYDCIMIQKETFPRCYPLFERRLAKKSQKVIFDFDDAIFLKYHNFYNKNFLNDLLKYCAHVICGNNFLAEYAAKFNKKVSVIPTVIDTDIYCAEPKTISDNLTIGWSGTLTTHQYLNILNQPLTQVFAKYKHLKLLIISNSRENIHLDIAKERIKFIPWDEKCVVSDLKKIDIGLMPLKNDDWAKGKCGLKALQYMSLSIPTICSPVGVNAEIIQDGENGFLAGNCAEWESKLIKLIEDHQLFLKISQNAGKTVQDKYSLQQWLPELIKVFKAVA